MFKKIGGLFSRNWYKIIFGLVFLAIFAFLYLYRLGSFVRGDSVYETTKYLGINGIEAILQNISLAPIKVLELIMVKIDEPNSTLIRLVSVFVTLISLIVFYRLILKWETHRIAMLSTLMFASSALSLNLGRFSSQEVIYFLVIPSLLLMGTWLKSKKYVKRLIYILPTCAILIYLPGFLLFSILLLTFFRKRLALAWKFTSRKMKISGSLTAVLILAPLAFALASYPSQIFKVLGIDRLTEISAREVLDKFLAIPNELFWDGLNQPHLWLSGTPVFDVVALIFATIGFYSYFKSDHTLRARLILGLLLVSLITVSLSTVASIVLVIPIIYLYIAKGLSFMLQNWFVVFPRNPAARNLGVILLFIPVFLSVGYNVEKYFVAWHDSPETAQALSNN